MTTTENPFEGIGEPPEGEDPEAQLSYLRKVIAAFDASGCTSKVYAPPRAGFVRVASYDCCD